jgi:LEA14-like dessication related protein
VRVAGTAVLFLLAIGCASLRAYDYEPPEVHLVDLRPIQGGLFEQRVRLDLRVVNPNDRELAARGLDLELELNQRPFARGVSRERFQVPALGEARVSVEASTSTIDLLQQVVGLGQPRSFDYRLHGRMFVDGASDGLAFDQTGRRGESSPP